MYSSMLLDDVVWVLYWLSTNYTEEQIVRCRLWQQLNTERLRTVYGAKLDVCKTVNLH